MKVCLINNLYKPFNRGGAENMVEMMAQGLNEAGHQVFVITTKPDSKKFSIFHRRGGAGNFQFSIYHFNSLYYNLNKIPKILRFFWHVWDMFNLANYFKVKRILRAEKPDVVITHNLIGLGFLIPWAITKSKIKHLHYLHDIQLIHPSGLMIFGQEKIVDSFWAKIYQAICRRLIDSPASVISPSNWLMKFHKQKGFFSKAKKVVLPNHTSPIVPLLIRRGEGEVFKFLFVGQIEYHKGILFLIDTFKSFKEKNCELLIAGIGSLLDQAKRLAQGDDRIKFLGWKNIDELYWRCDCLIVPSLCYENSPTVLSQAVSAGLPVIASKIGGIPELLSTQFLFESGDEKELIKKMAWATVTRDKLRQIGLSGRDSARPNEFNYIKKLTELIK